MASKEERLKDLLFCPVCFEYFTDSGDMVRRTLPCPHKLCTGCLKRLFEKGKRECPFCHERISEGTITADLSKGNVPLPVPRDVPMPEARHVEVKYEVEKTLYLDFQSFYDVTPVYDTAVFVVGRKQGVVTQVALLDLQTNKLRSEDLGRWATRITLVELDGRETLALCGHVYSNIYFIDLKTFEMIPPFSVGDKPGALCVSSPSTLLYSASTKVHILDCSGADPIHVRVIETELYGINDMCVVKNEGEELLVCVIDKIMTAQDLRTGEVKWRVDRKRFDGCFLSVASDDGGQVYICDVRQNIGTFHVSDGRYMGERQRALDALREQGITRPYKVRCNSDGSSLVVCHVKSVDGTEINFLSVVRVK